MIELRPFRFADVSAIDVQPRHRATVALILKHEALTRRAMEGPFAYTMERDGMLVAAAGIIEAPDLLGGPPIGRPWAILAAGAPMVAVTRAVKDVLGVFPGQVVADIDEDHGAAVRWAQALGFKRAAPGQWTFDAP